MENIFSTKNILKLIVLVNIVLLMWMIWGTIIGLELTSKQIDGGICSFLVIVACSLYKWIVIDNY